MCIHNTLYHSTIFKTITDELGNTKLSINKGFKGLFSGDFFKKKSILSDDDISALQAYNAEINRGVTSQTAFYRTMQNASVEAQNMAASANGMVVNLEQIPKVSKAGQVALKGLAMAGNMLLMWGISEAISAIATAIDNEANRVEYAQERLEEFNNTVSESKKELEDQQKWIEENGDRYEELARGVDNYGHNVSLTADEFSEYQSITKDIADMFPNMISGYNDQNDAIIKTKGNVDALTESYKENVKQAYASTLAKSSETYDDYKTSIEDAKTQKSGIEFLINSKNRKMWLGDNYGFTMADGSLSRDFRNILNEDLYDEITKYIKDNKSKFSSLDENGNISLQFSFENLSAELQQKIRSALSVANSTITSETSKVKPILEAFIYGEDGSSSGYGQLSEDGKQAIRNVISSLDDTFYSQFDSDTEMAAYFKSYFIEPLKDGLDDSDLAVKINTLFSIDKNDYSSYKEYVDAVLAKINELKTYKDANGKPIYSDVQIESLKKTFGVADIDSGGNTSGMNLINQTKEKYSKIKGAGEYIDTLKEDEIRVLYELKPDEGKSLESMKQAIDKMNQEAEQQTNKTAISSQKTFDEVWNSIGEGDDDAGKKAQEAKEKVLELAEAGKLTEKAFEKSSIADTFTQAGYSIEKATKKINDMVSSADQLASMKSGISSISSILGEKKENLSNKKTKNDGIGADTLSGMPDDVKAQADEYENFVKVLGNGASTMQQCREAANNLATAYVNSYNFLSKLTPETVGYYTSVLKQMGVENASEVVTNALAKQTYALRLEKLANSNATKEEITALQEEANQYGITSTALTNYVIQKRIANNNALDTSKSISNLIKLAKQCGATSNVVIALQNFLKSTSELESLYQKDLTDFSSNAATDLQHAPDAAANEKSEQIGKASAKISASRKKLLKLIKDSTKIGASVKIKPTSPSSGSKGSKGSKDSAKKSKQVIDWIERRLKNLQSTIDYTSSKLQNLFTVESKNSNLDKQIKTTTKLINEYGIAAEKYQQKANKVAKASTKTVKGKNGKKKKVKTKGLSKDVISKIKTGKLTKKTKLSSLIKEYGEDTANKIQSYIDYYDKAQDAKKNAEDQKAKKRELQVQKQTNIQEEADKKSAQYQAERELAQLKDKNGWIKKEIDSTKESYEAQIKAAEIQKDTVEKDKLIAEKKKALLALYQEEVDNIKSTYDERKKILETGVINNNGTRRTYGEQYYKNQVDLTESRGLTLNASWYKEQNKIERDKIAENEKERQELIAELSKFAEGTTEWYNLQSDIADCDNSIIEAKKAINENSSSIRELKNSIDEKIGEFLNSSYDELDFISGLLYGEETDTDKGILTDAGNLRAITDGLKIAFGESGANEFGKQLSTLEKLYSSNASMKQWEDAGFAGYFNDDGTLNTKAVEDKIKSLRSEVQSYINMQINGEKELIELGKQKYEAQKSYLQDIIDAKKNMLNIEKDIFSYERDIADKTKSVANLQKQINALRGDDSEEGRARLSKLQVSLDEAQRNLQDSEYDRYISDQQNMLDNLMTEYEDLLTNLTKDTDKILLDMYDYIKKNEGGLGDLFIQSSEKYGYATSQDLIDIVNALKGTNFVINKDVAKDNESGIDKVIGHKIVNKTNVNTNPPANSYDQSVSNAKTQQATNAQQIQEAEKMRKTDVINRALIPMKSGMGTNEYWTKTKGTPSSYVNQRLKNSSFNGNKILTEKGARALANTLRGESGFRFGNGSDLTKKSKSEIFSALNDFFKASSFATGGIVDYKPSGEDGLVWAKNGEGFVRPEDVPAVKEFVKYAPNLNELFQPLVNLPKVPDFVANRPTNTTSIGDVQFAFTLPNVVDANSLVTEIQSSQKVQRAIHEVTLGQANGNGKLSVKRIR